MAATIIVTPVADRQSRLTQEASIRQHRLTFKGRLQDLEVKVVPLDLLVYRLTNMRTDVLQVAYIRDHHVPDTFFSNGQEDPQAQRIQHGFLIELAKNKNKNIWIRLEETRRQDEPLIVTDAAVVLNGNRRLAAMRELHAENPASFADFGHIEVAILPQADESDLTELETDLQIAEDLRLPYGWIEEARGLRRQINFLNWNWNQASGHWRKREATLKALLSQLALAEQYLEYLGQPLHYELVGEDQQAFETLQSRLASQEGAGVDPTVIQAQRLTMFAVLKNKSDEEVQGRTYDYASKIDEITKRVMASPVIVATSAATITAPPAATSATTPGGTLTTAVPAAALDDPLADLPGAAAAVPAAVLQVLADADRSRDLAVAADQARDDMSDEARRAKKGNALAGNAQKINALAASLSLTNADEATLQTAAAQLVAALKPIIEAVVAILHERPEFVGELEWAPLGELLQAYVALAANQEA